MNADEQLLNRRVYGADHDDPDPGPQPGRPCPFCSSVTRRTHTWPRSSPGFPDTAPSPSQVRSADGGEDLQR